MAIEKYMAESLPTGLYRAFTKLPFVICAVYFDRKVRGLNVFNVLSLVNLKPLDHLELEAPKIAEPRLNKWSRWFKRCFQWFPAEH